MKELAYEIVSNIVGSPDKVEVEEKTEHGYQSLVIKVAQEDISRVIGKEGRIIKAIRNVFRIAALKQNKKIFIKLADDNNYKSEPEDISVAP